MAFSVFLLVGLASFSQDPQNTTSSLCGTIGTYFCRVLLDGFGWVAVLIPIVICIYGVILFRHRRLEHQGIRLGGLSLFLITVACLLAISFETSQLWHGYSFFSGGNIGHVLAGPVDKYLGPWGAAIILTVILLVSLLLLTDISYHDFLSYCHLSTRRIYRHFAEKTKKYLSSRRERNRARKAHRIEIRKARQAQKEEQAAMQAEATKTQMLTHEVEPDIRTELIILNNEEDEDPEESFGETSPGIIIEAHPLIREKEDDDNDLSPVQEHEPIVARDRPRQMEILNTQSIDFELPPINLLDHIPDIVEKESRESLLRKSDMLINKLAEFSIEGRVTEVCPGPVITRYEYEPAPGIKISKIIGLADDLALGMRSRFGLRIAPMPGKSTLGIEIPNQYRETVFLKDILLSDEFQAAKQKSILTLPLGKDTAGRPFISDLKRMPHLLIAGATGSGKSVCINTILAGLLYIAKPTHLRFLLIDPKMLELSDFNGIPHLREPVITDTKMAPDALNWAVSEMERRYRLLADTGVRNIDQYNNKVDAPEYSGNLEHMPYLVIVIDELADLMLTAAPAIEETIQRLAQMARAAGIHLIIATQRPSVDVITGVIKANLPCRLAFQVASRVDSRTIIDSIGAEKLLGMGDFIFIPPGTSQLIRAHGAYVSESEVKRIVEFLATQPSIDDEDSIFRSIESENGEFEDVDDPLFNDAVKLVLTSGLASISMLQRRLKVGHSRASRLIDCMELTGIVGPHIGSKPREILVDRDEYLERLKEINESGVYE
ncbi:DNA translocase FtsK [bacterium]|nr:DNA translocase FtsK [candidate division CSSED10-310 bacterium]